MMEHISYVYISDILFDIAYKPLQSTTASSVHEWNIGILMGAEIGLDMDYVAMQECCDVGID